MSIEIEFADGSDFSSVLDLLAQNSLPPDGLAGTTLLVAREEGRVVGSAGLELYGDAALLRSVAVEAGHRGQGLGVRLACAALDLAKERGVHEVYLLTTTAADFFPRLGFTRVTRDDVPAALRASVEFQSACPASAVVMKWP